VTNKHITHMDGGRVEIDGDAISVFLSEPIKFQRKQWVHLLTPREEAERTFLCCSPEYQIKAMLAKAFTSAKMQAHPEAD